MIFTPWDPPSHHGTLRARRLGGFTAAAGLAICLGCARPLPADGAMPTAEELGDLLSLEWRAPDALAHGHALLLPEPNSVTMGSTLELRVRDEVPRRHSDLRADAWGDEFTWEVVSGDGRLFPRRSGMSCRYLPQRVTVEEPVIVQATLTRTYVREGGRFARDTEVSVTVSLDARIVAPISGANLDAAGRLRGFEVGRYPDPRDPGLLRELGPGYNYVPQNAERFEIPPWFHPVTEESAQWSISDHLRLGDLVAHMQWEREMDLPQWVVIDPLLVTKLEDLARLMHASGHDFDHWTLIYGYRSPAYNLGRIARDGSDTLKSPFSQHMWGRACDLIIDTDGDLQIDDLNGDGEIDIRDAAVIMHHANLLDRRLRDTGDPRVGGAGLYDHHDHLERPVQSPYTHVDVRGFLRDDGTLFRWLEVMPDQRVEIWWGAPTAQELVRRMETIEPATQPAANPVIEVFNLPILD